MTFDAELSASSIMDELLLGKKLRMTFYSKTEMKSFRVRLHQIKNKKEKQYLSIGFIREEDIKSLLFEKISDEVGDDIFSYYISLGTRVRSFKFYPIKYIEQE